MARKLDDHRESAEATVACLLRISNWDEGDPTNRVGIGIRYRAVLSAGDARPLERLSIESHAPKDPKKW